MSKTAKSTFFTHQVLQEIFIGQYKWALAGYLFQTICPANVPQTITGRTSNIPENDFQPIVPKF